MLNASLPSKCCLKTENLFLFQNKFPFRKSCIYEQKNTRIKSNISKRSYSTRDMKMLQFRIKNNCWKTRNLKISQRGDLYMSRAGLPLELEKPHCIYSRRWEVSLKCTPNRADAASVLLLGLELASLCRAAQVCVWGTERVRDLWCTM